MAVARLAIERGAPAGMRLLRSMFVGRTIAVVGPPRSGKTTFANYVQYGAFEHLQETPTTYSATVSKRFDLTFGDRQNLEVIVKKLVDLPGRSPDLSEPIFEINPHAFVVVVDASAELCNPDDPTSTATWLEHFVIRLDQRWANASPRRNRLRSVSIALNKADLVDDDHIHQVGKRCRAIFDQHFRNARGRRLVEATFRKCSLVENPAQTKWVDSIIFEMARNLSR